MDNLLTVAFEAHHPAKNQGYGNDSRQTGPLSSRFLHKCGRWRV